MAVEDKNMVTLAIRTAYLKALQERLATAKAHLMTLGADPREREKCLIRIEILKELIAEEDQ